MYLQLTVASAALRNRPTFHIKTIFASPSWLQPNQGAREGNPVKFFIHSFSQTSIGEEEISEVVATLRSGWLTTGRSSRRSMKENFKPYVGQATRWR